jgi:hypothetical protein
MAHILVYLQRTPDGLHPASAVALCVAREVASDRGASITAIAHGDAGTFDQGIVRACGHFGADTVVFAGPSGVANLHGRLNPVHVLTPWTVEGLAAVADLPQGPVTPRWITGGWPGHAELDAVTGVIAGRPPWYDLGSDLEPEYEGEVDAAELPTWVKALPKDGPPASFVFAAPPVFIHATKPLSPALADTLSQLGSQPLDPSHVARCDNGTILWFDGGGEGLPTAAGERGPAVRVILCPGPSGSCQPNWSLADWVLPGAWDQVVDQLQRPPWSANPG